MPTTDPRITQYISKAAPFAQPILDHIRKLVHEVCPEVEETVKWGMPHFDYKGSLMLGMASFKQHCTLTFHKAPLLSDPEGLLKEVGESAMGQFGKITSLADLPSDKILKAYIREAAILNEAGVKVKKETKARPELPMPAYFGEALSAEPKALGFFENFSPSAKRDYIEWLTEAKTDATREKRLATALEWIAEGKPRHWKYQKK